MVEYGVTRNMTPSRNQELAIAEETERGAMLERLQREEDALRADMRARVSAPSVPARFSGPAQLPLVVINNVVAPPALAYWTLPPLFRALYFVFVGWWAGLAWSGVALLACLTIIGLPIGILMFALAPKVFFLW